MKKVFIVFLAALLMTTACSPHYVCKTYSGSKPKHRSR